MRRASSMVAPHTVVKHAVTADDAHLHVAERDAGADRELHLIDPRQAVERTAHLLHEGQARWAASRRGVERPQAAI